MTNPPRAMLAPTAFSAGDPLINLETGVVDQTVLDAMSQFDYAISYPPPRTRNGFKALQLLAKAGVKIIGKVTLDHAWPEKDTSCLQGALYIEALGKGAIIPMDPDGMPEDGGAIDVQKFGPADLVARIRYHLITHAPLPLEGIHIEAHGAGCEELRERLHNAVPLEMGLYWNNGQPRLIEWEKRARRGPMWENDPFQGATSGDPNGAFTQQMQRFLDGWDTEPIIFSAAMETSPTDPLNIQKYDYLIAKAALLYPAIAIFAAGEPNRIPWWTPEWQKLMRRVDLGTPTSSPLRVGVGRKMWRRTFTNGEVLVDPTYGQPTYTKPDARGRGWIIQ